MSLRRVRLSGRVEEHNPPDEARRCSCCGKRCKTASALLETFVETPRYTGAVYRASG